MGVMDKLKFWKKDDFSEFGDFGHDSMNPPDPLGANPNEPLALNDPLSQHDPLGAPDPLGGDPLSQPDPLPPRVNPLASGNSSFEQVSQSPTHDPFAPQQTAQSNTPSGDQMMGKDIEIISAKIETVRVSVENLGHKIDNLNQRLAAIEKIANDSQTQQW